MDHLEAELQAALAQLQAVNSPSVTREQSVTMRHLKAESKQLQEELADWESKYEQRVQEAVQKHFELESSLRAKVRHLEQKEEEKAYRVQELEYQLDNATRNLNCIESANVNLERRIEIMSELLACSPTRIDLAAETPGRARHGRPKSVIIPRFPTASSLMSPERPTQNMSPSSSPVLTRSSPNILMSPTNLVYSPDVSSSDESASNSISSAMGPPTSKPMRRMRRFGAGSVGPKPLILPSTSHSQLEQVSAPPATILELEHGALSSNFAFQQPFAQDNPWPGLLLHARRRASSEGKPKSFRDEGEDRIGRIVDLDLVPNSPGSTDSTPRDRNLDLMGSEMDAPLGRNLMDELTAAREYSSLDNDMDEDIEIVNDVMDNDQPGFASNTSTALVLARQLRSPSISRTRAGSKPLGVHTYPSLSILDGLRDFFGDIFKSPLALAKHLIERAQAQSWIPRPLLNIQWWLVGILLGPMAKKRLLIQAKKPCCAKATDSRDHPPDNETVPTESLAFGALYQTPPSNSPLPLIPSTCSSFSATTASSSGSRNRSLGAGKGKKRSPSVSSKNVTTTRAKNSCPHHAHGQRYKHSPLLWLKFSMTLAIAVGIAFRNGPSSLLKEAICECRRRGTMRGGDEGEGLEQGRV